MIMLPPVASFAELEAWLRGIPGQMTGIPTAVCQTGERYVEFREVMLARPADAKVIETEVAGQMARRLAEYFNAKNGMIYWRVPFEYDVSPTYTVVRYDELGPDRDFLTDRKCVMDKDWVRAACYCRLYRATHAFDGFDFAVTPTPPTVQEVAA